MQYYKKIEIDHYDDIVADTLNYLMYQKPDIYNRKLNATYYVLDLLEFKKFCPKLDLAFQRYNIVCDFAVAFVMRKNSDVPIHVDTYIKGNARINLPILNTEGSYTRFYTGGEFTKTINPVTKVPALVLKSLNGLKMVDRVEITQATVIRVNEPHDIVLNPNTNHRITLTLGFDRDPTFLLDD